MKMDFSISALCQTLAVSPSGYYDWHARQRRPGTRVLVDQALLQQLSVLHQQSRHTYGSPRLQVLLRRQGQRHGRNRIARLMRLGGLVGRQKRRYRIRTTDSAHGFALAPNRLAQRPPPQASNQVWVADVTYIPTEQGWVVFGRSARSLQPQDRGAGRLARAMTARWSCKPGSWLANTGNRPGSCSSIPIAAVPMPAVILEQPSERLESSAR